MEIIQSFVEKHPCYQFNLNPGSDLRYTSFQEKGPLGIVIYPVWCSSALDYINNFNKDFYTGCAHCLIKDRKAYQLLPWNYRGWHRRSEYNNTHVLILVSVPMTEWDYQLLLELCTFLKQTYQTNRLEENIAYFLFEENFPKDRFIKDLSQEKTLESPAPAKEEVTKEENQKSENKKSSFKVKVMVDSLNYRDGPGIQHKIVGAIQNKGTYQIVEEQQGWGKIESLGWIHLMHTKKI